jgi:protocatechuate 3,4-dioxygenase beta subunit
MPKKISRREAFSVLGMAGAALSAACAGDTPTSPTGITTTTPTTGTAAGACAVSPQETVGPYPSLIDLVRSDIREGRSGVPLVLKLSVVNVNDNCSPVRDAAVDIWQCDAEGHYSQYNQPGFNGVSQSFLRGIQATDTSGQVTFTTIYPGWYAGRATHIHAEVSVNGRSVKVTQVAFPENITAQVYATSAYAAHGQNPTSNTRDMVFADSLASETAIISGDPASGYVASFIVGIAV